MSNSSPFLDRDPIDTDIALEILSEGQINIVGRMPYSSNATFLVDIEHHAACPAQGIYKPHRGERPLWDFPEGLYQREAASFEMSEYLGWELIPPTVVRDGPFEIGSVQLFVPNEQEQHYFTLREDPRHTPAFQRLCIFDFVTNNTDRKSGHCLLGTDGHIYAIDNGLSFHQQFKLRTVLWDYAGDPIPADIIEDLERLLDEKVPESVARYLDGAEAAAVLTRARAIVAERRFPIDSSGRRYPWPLV